MTEQRDTWVQMEVWVRKTQTDEVWAALNDFGIASYPDSALVADDFPDDVIEHFRGEKPVLQVAAGERQCAIVSGNPVEGITGCGPFSSRTEAILFADTYVDESWWTLELEDPEWIKEVKG